MLATRLQAARQSRFVGRQNELSLFRSALTSEEPPFFVLHLYGPGGIGKTTLLRQFALVAQEEGASVSYVDMRGVEPTVEGLVTTFNKAITGGPETSYLDCIKPETRYVLLIDTYEVVIGMDDWLRESFLAGLPENVLIVLAARTPLSQAWRVDPGWQALTRSIPLRNLEPTDTLHYLQQRKVPQAQMQSILRFTHGHPLALSLVADAFVQRADLSFSALSAPPDVVRTLLEQFVQKVDDPLKRAALEASPLLRLTTESLLRELLGIEDARALFEWLQSLTFMEIGTEGLFPHDLVREALITELRWRSPERYAELHRRAREYYVALLNEASGVAQQRIITDLIYLHRDNPVIQHMYEWNIDGSFIADRMYAEDVPVLAATVTRFEGEESGRLAEYWMRQQPDATLVIRDRARTPLGFVMMLDLSRIRPDQHGVDFAVDRMLEHLRQQAPMRSGETATFFRYWMACDTYQEVSPIQSMLFVHFVRHYISKMGLTYTYMTCIDPDFWAPGFAYAEIKRMAELDFSIGGRTYGVYAHDWRVMSPGAWINLLGERELATFTPGVAPTVVEQVYVLSEVEFASAVGAALKDYATPEALRGNPLLRSRLVMDRAGVGASESERIAALRAHLKSAVDSLGASPKEGKFYRPLYHTYIQPADTQEMAAELLDLPFSTYRRHLKSGVSRVTELLWVLELGGDAAEH